MYKSIIFSCLLLLLTACENNKLPKECQKIHEVIKQLNLELDTNPYVLVDIANNEKKRLKLTAKAYKKGGPIKGCIVISEFLQSELKSLREAKSEEEVEKILR